MSAPTDCYTGCQTPVLGPGVHSAPPQITHTVTNLPLPHLATQIHGLPMTGADVVELGLIGLAMVAVGYFTIMHERYLDRKQGLD